MSKEASKEVVCIYTALILMDDGWPSTF